MRSSPLQLSMGTDLFADTNIPAAPQVLVFGTTEFLTTYTEDQIKKRWKLWNSDDPLPNRMARGSHWAPCAEGLTPACLQDRTVVMGRACSFQDECFTRREIFGQDFRVHINTDFVVRGRSDLHLVWFSDEACGAGAGAHLQHVYAFSSARHSFKLHVPLVCRACPTSHGVGLFDFDAVATRCDECVSPFYLEVALGTHSGCSETVAYNKQYEFAQHLVLVRWRPQDRLRCAACRSLVAADGFAQG